MNRKVKSEFSSNDRVHLDEFIREVQKNMQIDNGSTNKQTYRDILSPYIKKFDPDIYEILENEGEFYAKQGDIQAFKHRAYGRILTPDIASTLLDNATQYRKNYRELFYRCLGIVVVCTLGYFGCKAFNASQKNTPENIHTELKNNSNEFYYAIDSTTSERLMQIAKRLEKNGNSYSIENDSIEITLGQGVIHYEKSTNIYRILWKQSGLDGNHTYFVNVEYQNGNKVQTDLNASEYNTTLQKVIEDIEGMRRNTLPQHHE